MSEMPARIWAGANSPSPLSRYWFDVKPNYPRGVEFVRADIAERMAEALEVLLGEATSFNVSGVYFDESCMGHKGPDLARSALSAWKDGR